VTTDSVRDELFESPQCETSFSNESGQDLESFIEQISSVPNRVFNFQRDENCWDLSVVFTTDEQLRQLHAAHLSDDSLTDVITFHYGSADESEDMHFGEIVISVDRAIEQAADEAWSLEEELTFLLVHGILHLCGWNDTTDQERLCMHDRQRDIMAILSHRDAPTP
jgi:rRNA maturation RNase YbeY